MIHVVPIAYQTLKLPRPIAYTLFPPSGILIPAPCVSDLRVTLQKVALQAAGSAEDPVVVS